MRQFLQFTRKNGNIKFQIVFVLLIWTLMMPLFTTVVQAQNCTVNAGVDDSVCPNQQLQLHGVSAGLYTGTGNIHWTQKSGPSVTIVDPYNPETFITGYTSDGHYSFYLWAKCNASSSSETGHSSTNKKLHKIYRKHHHL